MKQFFFLPIYCQHTWVRGVCLVLATISYIAIHSFFFLFLSKNKNKVLSFSLVSCKKILFSDSIIRMAQSRLEKVGTIYSRIRGLLSTGALKQEQVCLFFKIIGFLVLFFVFFPRKRWGFKCEKTKKMIFFFPFFFYTPCEMCWCILYYYFCYRIFPPEVEY